MNGRFDLSAMASLVTAGAVVFAISFAFLEWRQVERRRREAVAFEVMRSFQTPETARALILLASPPEGLRPEEYERREGFVSAIAVITPQYELGRDGA